MKRVLTISLLFFLFLGQAGYQFVFQTMKEIHKEKMIADILPNIKESNLVRIDAADEAIYWVEEGREMIYQGRLYDIVRTSGEPNQLLYHCLADGKEDDINNISNAVTAGNADQAGTHKNIKLQLFTLEYILSPTAATNPPVWVDINRTFGSSACTPWFFSVCDNIAPPPRA